MTGPSVYNSGGKTLRPLQSLKTRRLGLAGAAGALVLLGGLAAHAAFHDVAHISLKLADPNEGPARITMAPAANRAMPSVVKISMTKVVKTPAAFSPGDDGGFNDPFQQFFGGNPFGDDGGNGSGRHSRRFQSPPQQHREGGLGSGVIVSPDGYILTNNHVVDGASTVTVTLPDRREFKAKVVGADPKTDIAVVKIDASNLPAITIGDSSKLQVGDAVLAIGNPYGIGQTVTAGIVSATGRTDLGIEEYENFIQTDASINPGNSGGALVNDRGELVGINTAILAPGSGGNQGIGFAVPVNLARNVMDEIATNGHVTRTYLGVTVQDVTPALQKAMHLETLNGALVSSVAPNSPAQKAGLQAGDVILAMNGDRVGQSNDLRMNVSIMKPDQTVHLKINRNGQVMEVPVTVGVMPGEKVERAANNAGESESVLNGIQVQTLDEQTAQQLHLPAGTRGVVVTNVDPNSDAAAQGLQEGDVIQQVNRQPVANVQDLHRALGKSSGDPLLLVNRNGNQIFIAG
jgi:serine protease Do